MNDFVRCNKVSGVYWLNETIEELKISVKLKRPDDILSLPKFEDYTNESDRIAIQPKIEEHTFQWQEKCINAWEKKQYSEIHNCITDTEMKYYELIRNTEIIPTKVFTYIHQDHRHPLPLSKIKKESSNLELCMEYLNLNDAVGSIGKAFGRKSDSMSHLLKSSSSLFEEDKWTAMHVVFDHSDNNESEDNFIKQESTLLSIYHNTKQNYVILVPDVNDLDSNPYSIEGNTPIDFKYGVSVDFGKMGGGDELELLLTRLHNKWEKKHRVLVDFIMPPLRSRHYHVTIELLSAEGFDMENLYIEYTIKLPEGIKCNDTLHGRTHTSSPASEDKDVWNFGQLVELWLETGNTDPSPLKLYLEVISTDWRHHHRTEGYIYHPLPLSPGINAQELTCLRPEQKSWRGEENRFFVGGCNLIQDLEVLSKTDGQNANFIYITTGKIHLRYSVIAQSGSSGTPGIPGVPGVSGVPGVYPSSSGSSALLLGAEAALDKYRKARARLAAATKDIYIGSGDA